MLDRHGNTLHKTGKIRNLFGKIIKLIKQLNDGNGGREDEADGRGGIPPDQMGSGGAGAGRLVGYQRTGSRGTGVCSASQLPHWVPQTNGETRRGACRQKHCRQRR